MFTVDVDHRKAKAPVSLRAQVSIIGASLMRATSETGIGEASPGLPPLALEHFLFDP